MRFFRVLLTAGIALLLSAALAAQTQQSAAPPLPDIPKLMHEVEEHQKQLDKVRENYTYTSLQTTQQLDSNGQVKKTETRELDVFFVNGRQIERLVKKDGRPLTDEEEQKESERVNRLVERMEKLQPEQPKEKDDLTVSRILEIMDVSHPRRESYRGRATIVFDVAGRKDAKTHGLNEEVFKKFQGSVWIDEADRQVARIDVSLSDNLHVAGGLVINIEKGSHFIFDQAPVNGEIWLPAGGEGTAQGRLLLVKTMREHITERDSDYKRFRVEAEQGKNVKAVPEQKR